MTHVYVVVETVSHVFELVFETQAAAEQYVEHVTKRRKQRNRPKPAYSILKCVLCREDHA